MRKKPYMQSELFDTIVARLKEKGLLPSILDYSNADRYSSDRPITNYEFDFGNSLKYGGSEGIYLDIYIDGYDYNEKEHYRRHIGTFKTLYEDNASMRTMALLLADFVTEGTRFVNEFIDDFTWEGFDVGYVENGEKTYIWSGCSSEESIGKRKAELFEKHNTVIVRDNATRKETIYEKEV